MILFMTICLGLAALAFRHGETAEALLLLVQACLIVAMITILKWSGRRKN
jgi:UDP-GlcNAc:undecaprenyl-phosphate GlcNAc-1-phosphate transferase